MQGNLQVIFSRHSEEQNWVLSIFSQALWRQANLLVWSAIFNKNNNFFEIQQNPVFMNTVLSLQLRHQQWQSGWQLNRQEVNLRGAVPIWKTHAFLPASYSAIWKTPDFT